MKDILIVNQERLKKEIMFTFSFNVVAQNLSLQIIVRK